MPNSECRIPNTEYRIPKASLLAFFGLLVVTLTTFGNDVAPVTLNGLDIETPKHRIKLAPTGLPAQIVIKAGAAELPLELRGKDAKALGRAVLQAIGRGEQLREPVRIIVRIKGKTFVAAPVVPIKPRLNGKSVSATGKLKAGPVPLTLTVVYGESGRMDLTLAYGGRRRRITALALIFALNGPVDTVIPGNPVAEQVRAYKAAEFAPAPGEGTVWANTGRFVPKHGRNLPGVLSRVFIGNGDRGFTWLAATPAGFELNKAAPSMVLKRDRAGQVTWEVLLVNRKTRLTKPRQVKFSILTHPAYPKPANVRARAWIAPLTGLPRADRIHDRQEGIEFVTLTGPAGGDALSVKQHLAATYPISLFRYLAGTHTGLGARLNTNAVKLIRPGMCPAVDRMALGRALLHDIGVEAVTLAHLGEAATVVKALAEFGAFANDGKTEFIPYWRTGAIIRYGEEFTAGDAFATTTTDPLADVHLSVWRRPHKQQAKAMIVVVNESARPFREQLYVFDPKRLFGGPNRVLASQLIAGWDMSRIPKDSDWNRARLQNTVLSHGGRRDAGADVSLLDMTDKGFVRRAAAKGDLEVYGRVYIAPNSFRILYGAGR